MRFKASCAAGSFRLSAMPRLLRLTAMKAADSPFTAGRFMRRVSSPPGTRSTLITSAPRSASSMPQVGPAMICANSRTLTPASGPGITQLSDFARRRLRRAGQILHRGLHAFLLHRHAGEAEAHLHAGERAHQREIVEVAEMADAEHLAAQLGEAGAERHVERLEDDLAQAVRVVASGHQHRGQRSRILARIERENLHA